MQRRFSSATRRYALALAAVAALASTTPAAAQSQDAPAVTAAAQVTTNPMPVRSHTSPSIAVNPKNGRLALVESDVRGASRACNVHVSADGGRSWAPGGEIMTKPYTDCSFRGEYGPYATAAYGRDGTLSRSTGTAPSTPSSGPGPARSRSWPPTRTRPTST